jgi:hypothetical protein
LATVFVESVIDTFADAAQSRVEEPQEAAQPLTIVADAAVTREEDAA